MCIVKTPKVKATDAANKTPDPAIIRNPYLDGVDPETKALRMGSSSLRIERAGSGAASSSPASPAAPPVSVAPPLYSNPSNVYVGMALKKIIPVLGRGGPTGKITRQVAP